MAVSSHDLGNQLKAKKVNGQGPGPVKQTTPFKVSVRNRAKPVRLPRR